MHPLKLVAAVAGLLALLSSAPAQAASISAGPANFDESFGGARFKSLVIGGDNNREILVGEAPGTPGLFSESDFVWTSSTAVSVTYDATADTLSATAGGTTVTYNTYLASQSATAADVDALQLFLRANVPSGATGSVALNNLVVDGMALGSFMVADNQQENFTITGIDFSDGWTATGDIVLAGVTRGNENAKIEFTTGKLVPEPGSTAMAAIAGVGILLRRRR